MSLSLLSNFKMNFQQIYKWTASSEFGTYRLCEQRRFRRACASAQSRQKTLLAHTSSESRGTFRQKARSLAPLNGWACAVKICHGGMLEDTNSLDGPQIMLFNNNTGSFLYVNKRSIINNEPEKYSCAGFELPW